MTEPTHYFILIHHAHLFTSLLSFGSSLQFASSWTTSHSPSTQQTAHGLELMCRWTRSPLHRLQTGWCEPALPQKALVAVMWFCAWVNVPEETCFPIPSSAFSRLILLRSTEPLIHQWTETEPAKVEEPLLESDSGLWQRWSGRRLSRGSSYNEQEQLVSRYHLFLWHLNLWSKP